jgi:hypothetical protein
VKQAKHQIKYSWKHGARISLKADVVGPCLKQLAERYGKSVAAKKLLEEARDREHVTHRHFDWNDKTAGEKYRLDQARELLGSIMFEVVTPKGAGESTRLFAAIREKEEPNKSRYVLFEHAMSDKNLREQVLQRALAELSSFKVKYQRLTELADVFKAIDKLLKDKKP